MKAAEFAKLFSTLILLIAYSCTPATTEEKTESADGTNSSASDTSVAVEFFDLDNLEQDQTVEFTSGSVDVPANVAIPAITSLRIIISEISDPMFPDARSQISVRVEGVDPSGPLAPGSLLQPIAIALNKPDPFDDAQARGIFVSANGNQAVANGELTITTGTVGFEVPPSIAELADGVEVYLFDSAGSGGSGAPAPDGLSLDVTTGPITGGTAVTITGTNFVSGATVLFGTNPCASVTFNSETSLTCNATPAGASAATVDVVITNPDTQSDTMNGAFTYFAPAPDLTSLTVNNGSTLGGTLLGLVGTNFVSGATVTVDGAACTNVTFVDATELTCLTPAGSGGSLDVIVTNPDAQADTLAGSFTYDAENWEATTSVAAPAERRYHSLIRAGDEIIIWGGSDLGTPLNTGGKFDIAAETWSITTTTGAPSARTTHTAVWTGTEMIIWGGSNGGVRQNTGSRYTPGIDSWSATTTTDAPSAREFHSACWTGTQKFVFGGVDASDVTNTGGLYNPSTDTWTATSTVGAPAARWEQKMVCDDTHAYVWGGQNLSATVRYSDGFKYNFSTDTWTALSTTGDPTVYRQHSMAIDKVGGKIFVFGGAIDGGSPTTNEGWIYDIGGNSWTAMTTTSAPTNRRMNAAIWTGSRLMVWGGSFGENTGGIYNPTGDSWSATTTTGAPTGRQFEYATVPIWTGSRVFIWGGYGSGSEYDTGGMYTP